jgi:hypothetical protein
MTREERTEFYQETRRLIYADLHAEMGPVDPRTLARVLNRVVDKLEALEDRSAEETVAMMTQLDALEILAAEANPRGQRHDEATLADARAALADERTE